MPGGDRSGPMGMGPMTGRGAGFCSGVNRTGYFNAVPGPGAGMGAGRGGMFRRAAGGRGWRNQYYATGMPGWMRFGSTGGGVQADLSADKEVLRQRSQALQSELDAINKRLDDMD